MFSKGPHISIEAHSLVPRILKIAEHDFAQWPDTVKSVTIAIAEELFLAMYNPYIPSEIVKKSVYDHFEMFRRSFAHHYATAIAEGITMFWSTHERTLDFRKEIISRLEEILPADAIDTSRHSRIANATDATDLRLELPLLVVTPHDAKQVSKIVQLANTMQFVLIPRGGGSGLTGGAIPAHKHAVILSTNKLTNIGPVDIENKTIAVEAGVLTVEAIQAAGQAGQLFSVDPASKAASSIGGNISENAGGPLCFEYGTTIDNLLSYRMVTPTGEVIEVTRKNHPRHKILPNEVAIFEVRDISGGLRNIVKIPGSSLRKPGLGKDVTNKTLCGLPGVQKEGIDGVIVDAIFILHEQLKHFKVMVLEFFGRSMENSMLVITDVVALRNQIRTLGDLVKISALEEFNAKYVQAIGYKKKSVQYEGDPISVLILQLDSNDLGTLEKSVQQIVSICQNYCGVDAFIAKDETEAEVFWEDRHKLSAIAKRTSGFKINEDVVIPLKAIPEFARFLEELNLECMARAYRTALREAGNLPELPVEDSRIVEELAYASRIIHHEVTALDLSDDELQLHAILSLRSLGESSPALAKSMTEIEKKMIRTCICVASHMHAGDGNCHVNIPVNSNDPIMLKNAEKVAHIVMAKAQELEGEVTGEHGIGITKIAFLTDEKMTAIAEFKELVDPRNTMNPFKLTQRELPVSPFTFSFNHLIHDIGQSGLQDKERLTSLLANIQACTRCGKCKQHCPMRYPSRSLHYEPRNKNLILGALIEAIYYTQMNTGKPSPFLLSELRTLMEHCTGCGKCESVCPIKIASSEVALTLRGYLEEEHAGGHPIKLAVLNAVAADPSSRLPKIAKLASFGQRVQNKAVHALPKSIRSYITSPLFSGPGPQPAYRNLHEALVMSRGSLFVPTGEVKGTVMYFPGCGGSIFFRDIALAGISLLLHAGYAVLLPEKHLCCGYPLLAAGAAEAFATNQDRNITHLRELAENAKEKGYLVTKVLTACGSCRDGMERHFIGTVLAKNNDVPVAVEDVTTFLLSLPKENSDDAGSTPESYCVIGQKILYHAPCHAESPGVKKTVAAKHYAKALAEHTGAKVHVSPGCCGESGLGAITSPEIYNKLRAKKALQLDKNLSVVSATTPVIVSCPSCKMGITRIFLQKGEKRPVQHTLEFLAEMAFGAKWQKKCKKLIGSSTATSGTRLVAMSELLSVQITEKENKKE